MWNNINTCPDGIKVLTRINDKCGIRNVQVTVRKGNLFYVDGLYVYYTPTEWKYYTPTEWKWK